MEAVVKHDVMPVKGGNLEIETPHGAARLGCFFDPVYGDTVSEPDSGEASGTSVLGLPSFCSR